MVERNQRADDSRFKSWVQNILGIMVLAAIPTIAANLLVDWSDYRVDSSRLDELIERVNELEKWRLFTTENGFRPEDRRLLRQAIASNTQALQQLKESINDHNNQSERWKEKILQLEKNSHYHRYQVESEK